MGRESGGSTFTAEDWITDDEAFNRKKTKFLKQTGKFRIKTIDLKDKLYTLVEDVLNSK
jgi:colicin import membrane protein